jgi:hypothetical protein
MLPSRSRVNLTASPSARLACFAIAMGMRMARLFPHLAILESFGMCLPFEDSPSWVGRKMAGGVEAAGDERHAEGR